MSVVITVVPTGQIAATQASSRRPTSLKVVAVVHQAYHAGAAVTHIYLRDAEQ